MVHIKICDDTSHKRTPSNHTNIGTELLSCFLLLILCSPLVFTGGCGPDRGFEEIHVPFFGSGVYLHSSGAQVTCDWAAKFG